MRSRVDLSIGRPVVRRVAVLELLAAAVGIIVAVSAAALAALAVTRRRDGFAAFCVWVALIGATITLVSL